MAEAFLGLGGNLGDSRAVLDQAVTLLCDSKNITLKARSSDYQTPPWGVTKQPPFVNLCIVVDTALTPHQLLERTQGVEATLGRERTAEQHWGPRTCDIDILAYDDVVLNTPELTLPHPRIFARGFVLMPLAEIAPDAVIGGRQIHDALQEADTRGIVRLPPR
jgi:2-amino-4-hydroxy-6-hydroxymethyldihydropteridine diphosphokinase